MKLVVGLGNPGRKYRDTRHNIGYEVLAELFRQFPGDRPTAKFESELVEINHNGHRAILLSPLTYMNNSGRAVKAAVDFYKISLLDTIIVCDDFNLELGRLRFRPSGSSGGQKGLQDIIERMGTQEVPRLRIGIGTPPPKWQTADFVLSKFHGDEIETMRQSIERSAQGILVWMENGIQDCMNRFNADPNRPESEKKPKPDKKGEDEPSSDQDGEDRANHSNDSQG